MWELTVPPASRKVEKLKAKGNVHRLVSLLGHRDETVADEAQAALVSLGHPLAVPHLAAALADEAVRERAASVLVAFGNTQLVHALKVMDVESACRVLDVLADERVLELLGALPETRAAELSRVVDTLTDERILELLGTLPEDKAATLRRRSIHRLRRLKDPRAFDHLVESVAHGAEESVEAAAALEERGDERAIAPIKAAIRRNDPTKHMLKLRLLGKLGDAWAVDQLVAIITDPEAGRDPKLDELQARYHDPGDPLVTSAELTRRIAIGYLAGEIGYGGKWVPGVGGPRAVDALLEVLENPPIPAFLEDAVFEALGELGDARAIEPLRRFLEIQRLKREQERVGRGEGGLKSGIFPAEPAEPTMSERRASRALERLGVSEP
ncbi:MAG: HEAT repeat domain-containing protein [Vicinamibacteria bacterium]